MLIVMVDLLECIVIGAFRAKFFSVWPLNFELAYFCPSSSRKMAVCLISACIERESIELHDVSARPSM